MLGLGRRFQSGHLQADILAPGLFLEDDEPIKRSHVERLRDWPLEEDLRAPFGSTGIAKILLMGIDSIPSMRKMSI